MRAKVWNDSDFEWTETFKGDELRIKPHSCIEMEFFDAHQFKGQYGKHKVDMAGKLIDDPKNYKKIRVEKILDEAEELEASSKHVCMSCKHVSPSVEELNAHITVRHANQEKLEIPEMDERLKKKKAIAS